MKQHCVDALNGIAHFYPRDNSQTIDPILEGFPDTVADSAFNPEGGGVKFPVRSYRTTIDIIHDTIDDWQLKSRNDNFWVNIIHTKKKKNMKDDYRKLKTGENIIQAFCWIPL